MCKAWHAVAEALFYGCIKLCQFVDGYDFGGLGPPCPPVAALVWSFSAHPRLATLVHELRLHASTLRTPNETQYWTKLISTCTNLRRLHIHGWNRQEICGLRTGLSKVSLQVLHIEALFEGYADSAEEDAGEVEEDTASFADERQLLELMRCWPDLQELAVLEGVILISTPTSSKQSSTVNASDVWTEPPKSVWEASLGKRFRLGTASSANFPVGPSDVWPGLRKLSPGFLTKAWLSALPSMAPNLRAFTPGRVRLAGASLNNALVAWSSTLRHLRLNVTYCLETYEGNASRRSDVALGASLTKFHVLESAELDSLLLPPADLRYAPPSLKNFVLSMDADELPFLTPALENARTAPGLRTLAVRVPLDDTLRFNFPTPKAAPADIDALARVCVDRGVALDVSAPGCQLHVRYSRGPYC